MNCPFCNIVSNDTNKRIVRRNDLAIMFRDAYPISQGHTLVIPKRHISSFFEISNEERDAIFDLVSKEKIVLDNELNPAGYNIGINDGPVAGQTVLHLHIHLIPRYEGDVDDPRGGVRWIVPDKAKYWDA